MKIKIKVIAGASKNEVVLEKSNSEISLKVKTSAPALEGKANKAVIEMLAKHFKVKKSQIKIAVGATSNLKIVEIL